MEFDLPQCEICGQKFSSKKELRSHIEAHLGQPRIVLKRISNVKGGKKKHSDKYKLNKDQSGKLKITLKKQGLSDGLKLTIKKSSLSKDFTIINSNAGYDTENSATVGNLAGTKENERVEAQEETSYQSYKDMTVNEKVIPTFIFF